MFIEIELFFLFLILGSVVGLLAGLLGVGGGGIMVPVLTAIFLMQDIHIEHVLHVALGTSMASMVVTSLSSLLAHNSKGAVKWKVVKGMATGIISGSFMATFLASHISSFILALFFSAFMFYLSFQMFFSKQPASSNVMPGHKSLFIVGSGIGAVSAFVSIGGGSLMVPYLSWKNIEIRKAIGTSAAIGFPISIAGTAGYVINGWSISSFENYSYGFVYLPAVLLISIASFMTAPVGVRLAHHLSVDKLKKIFAILMILLSLNMLFSIS